MVQWINIQKDCKDSIREAFGSTIWEISNHSQQTMVLHTQEPITRPILTWELNLQAQKFKKSSKQTDWSKSRLLNKEYKSPKLDFHKNHNDVKKLF